MAYDATDDDLLEDAPGGAGAPSGDYAPADDDLEMTGDSQSWSYYAGGADAYGDPEDGAFDDDGEAVPGVVDDDAWLGAGAEDAGQPAGEDEDRAYAEPADDAVYAFDDAAAAANEAQVDGYDLYADDAQEPADETPAQAAETQALPIASRGYVPVMRPEKLAQYHAPRPAAPEPYRQQDRAMASLLEEDPEAEAAYRALVGRREERKRRRRVYAVVAAVAVLTAVAVFALRDRFSPAEGDISDYAPATYTVMREDFTSTVQSSGALQPASSVVVTPELSGIITEVRVKEGDTVKEGDVLFTLKNDEVTKAVSDAEAQLRTAENTASNAASSVTNAYNAYNAAVDAYNAAQAAGQQGAAFDEVELRAAITTAEAARDSANAAVTEARSALDQANQQAEKLTVKAPISGSVVSLGAVVGAAVGGATGATAQATSSTLAQIADVSQMKVTVQVNEIDISSISPGQQAQVTFSALTGLELGATVESIASVASGAGGEEAVSSGGIVTYGVVLVIPEPDAKLKPGMTASVTIVTQDVPNALVVPLSAVAQGEDGSSYVEVVIDEETFTTAQRIVKLGARGSSEVVVEEGLSEGDVILLANTGAGDAVELEQGTEEGALAEMAVA